MNPLVVQIVKGLLLLSRIRAPLEGTVGALLVPQIRDDTASIAEYIAKNERLPTIVGVLLDLLLILDRLRSALKDSPPTSRTVLCHFQTTNQ